MWCDVGVINAFRLPESVFLNNVSGSQYEYFSDNLNKCRMLIIHCMKPLQNWHLWHISSLCVARKLA
ncbi:MAG: hypothetical protein IJV35_10505 [Neisseriaceae bacterium]|nr:hypothetical protein [Neisseriaceae bacterium]